MQKICLMIVLYSLWIGQVYGETRYISDVVYVPMRTGPGNEYRIVNRGLKTGTELLLLEADAGNDFSKVKTGDQEGYIPTQFLMEKEPASRQLPIVLDRVSQMEKDNRKLQMLVDESQIKLEEVTSELDKAENKIDSQQSEITKLKNVCAEHIAIANQNQRLVVENEQLSDQIQIVTEQNQNLMMDQSLRWYLFGAATIFLGILVGLFLPMLKFRKKESQWI